MNWAPELDEVKRRREGALELGGPDKVERHRAAGKLTVRERIAQIVDAGSFDEIGSVSGFPSYDADGQLFSSRRPTSCAAWPASKTAQFSSQQTTSRYAGAPMTAACTTSSCMPRPSRGAGGSRCYVW